MTTERITEEQSIEQYKGFTLIGFPASSESRDKVISYLEINGEGRENVKTAECFLDHQMLGSGIPITPKPLVAYSVQNGLETIEEANRKRDEKLSPKNFSRRYEWRNFNPSSEGIEALDEALEIHTPRIEEIVQKGIAGWKRQRLDLGRPLLGNPREQDYLKSYGFNTGLSFLEFSLGIEPYDNESGLTDHPRVREIAIRTNPEGNPIAVITDGELLDQIPFRRTYDWCGHIIEPTKEGLVIYNGEMEGRK